jgi:GR25 family glycosyltransferase involved in LPS biosynthesis
MEFKTYCISLKSDEYRREWMRSIKDKIGVEFQFFDALEPKDVTVELEKKHFVDNYLIEWDFSQKATMATFLSHLSLIKLSLKNKNNILIIEDDIDIVNSFDWKNVDFKKFDVYNLGVEGSCFSYFVSYEGAIKLVDYFDNKKIKYPYDYELSIIKVKKMKIKTLPKNIFIQLDTFKSNIAPNGYKIKKNKLI